MVLAAQAKLQKEVMKKSIQALAIYKKKVEEMGFEETPLPLPPCAAAASGSEKIPGITKALDTVMTNDGAMDVDVPRMQQRSVEMEI